MNPVILDVCVVTCVLLGIAFGLLLASYIMLQAFNVMFKLFFSIKIFVEFLNWKHRQKALAKQKGGR